MKCRICDREVTKTFVDLGHQPPSNAYLTKDDLQKPEVTYPLRVYVCEECWLVQLPAHVPGSELFTDTYAYFSSVSSSWVEHARRYVTMAKDRFGLDRNSLVVELASNDGYLLQFVQQAGIPCVGFEPTACTAAAAREKGIETIESFFGAASAGRFVAERGRADLVVGNNVLAHVPDLNDFVAGVARLLKSGGVATFEFPHIARLVDGLQFDTIYHEHYSYFSLTTVRTVFESHGLRIFDVEELNTHGGSLRIIASLREGASQSVTPAVERLLLEERDAGLLGASWYDGFQLRVNQLKNSLLTFLLDARHQGKLVAGYGAAAKGNTLLNYAGVREDLVSFVCDAAASKQGQFLPGSHIPIVSPAELNTRRPDYVLILPWNLSDEICEQHGYISSWGGQFVKAVPELVVMGA